MPPSPVKCMHNASLTFHHKTETEPLFVSDSHGRAGSTSTVMFLLLHASTFLTLLHLLGFLLTKLFVHLLAEPSTADHQSCRRTHLVAGEGEAVNEEFDSSDVFSSEESLFFFYGEGFVSDPSVEEAEQIIVDGQLEDCGVISGTAKDEGRGEIGDSLSDHEEEAEFEQQEEEEMEDNKEEEMPKNEKVVFDVNKAEQFDSKKFKLEEHTFGASLTSESTSKSSMEWRSSAIFSDSVTECPFSSSSRRSSSHWETYTLFRKYDEEMMFFDRICAQKLTETETFRSLKYQTRSSTSQRIIHKQNKKQGSHRDPYRELECVYVAQICLAWEALSWNYNYFRQKNSKGSESDQKSCCTAWIAEQFQQFQVLLQRFIENEPYERGRRPEIFARTRIFSPKLLQVPEFREADELRKDEMVSSAEFLPILDHAIGTFMIFLKADKETPCQMLKALFKRKTSSADPNHLHFLKKTNKNNKMTLKDLLRPRRCLKRQRVKGKQEMDVLMGLTDMKIVSRVLRMPEIRQEQLQWCEEKMSKVKVLDGRIQRDSSPLFFPVH
ncbi:uncharacterized protein LOC121985803 isoform X3 [Zingiber officinale]|uniref:uncharacterized protein LOC121985802 isoform X3 n=1 Tax=Zingiber officinale TaxID=94328 RepID=UPI001C4B62D1|nr:uncharacterized protein LOC121985802 isoform X3 [Zingiber officinale]XP_042395395.1 uncharacterized protein LOC121985803 isoform X3 [Zingiber officinale]